MPAVVAAGVLAVAIATGWQRLAVVSWTVVTALLMTWCVFTGTSSVSLDFSQSNSHWMWLVGLLLQAAEV